MYKKFVEYMKDFLDEDSSPDFWYDIASEEARKLLLLFTESDWRELTKGLNMQPLEYKKKLAYCLDDIESREQLNVLLLLTNTTDSELLEICIDSLRNFLDGDSVKSILQNQILIESINKLLPNAGPVTKKIYEDFLSKLGQNDFCGV